MEEQEFLNKVRKVKESRNHKVKNSYGIYDGYKFYRKNKPKDPKYVLTESQYFAITRKVNEFLAEALSKGEDVILPFRLGRIEVRKYESRITWDGKKVKSNLPIDWDRTLKLWYEDEEAYKNKTLIKIEEKEIYKIFYNRNKIKGYEYSIGWGLNEKSITIMSSNLSYKQLKYYICNIL